MGLAGYFKQSRGERYCGGKGITDSREGLQALQAVTVGTQAFKLLTRNFNVKNPSSRLKRCKSCQVNEETRGDVRVPMCITDTKDSPWQKIYFDIMDPSMTSGKGMMYLLTCQDNWSKCFIATPLDN
jgi:hypothetical protein